MGYQLRTPGFYVCRSFIKSDIDKRHEKASVFDIRCYTSELNLNHEGDFE